MTTAHDSANEDGILVKECLMGSRNAWDRFYGQFLPLVHKIVRSQLRWQPNLFEDAIQNVFLALYTDLRSYDNRYPLSKFVWMVAQRVCIDEYRMVKAAKRDAETVPVDHHDGRTPGYTMLRSQSYQQETQLIEREDVSLLREAFLRLGKKCSELLSLRYFEELSFQEIAGRLGANKKSLAVIAGRCIDELKGRYAEVERKGPGS